MSFMLQRFNEVDQIGIKFLSRFWLLTILHSHHGPLLVIDGKGTRSVMILAWFVDCYDVDHTFVFGGEGCKGPSTKSITTLFCNSAMYCVFDDLQTPTGFVCRWRFDFACGHNDS